MDMNTMQRNLFIKVYRIRCGSEEEWDSIETKNINIFRYQTINMLKTSFLFLISQKEQKKGTKRICK